MRQGGNLGAAKPHQTIPKPTTSETYNTIRGVVFGIAMEWQACRILSKAEVTTCEILVQEKDLSSWAKESLPEYLSGALQDGAKV